MGRRFACPLRRLAAIFAGLALLAAAPAAFAETTFTYTLPDGRTGVITLPPAEEFENGDHWDAYAADATADMNVNTGFKGQVAYSFVKIDGAWAQSKMDLQAFINGGGEKGRHFKDIGRDPPDYPGGARPGQLFATPDGVLHRFDGGQWVTIPVGSVIDTPDGKHLTIDRRVLPAEAEQIDGAFRRAEAATPAQPAAAAETPAQPPAAQAPQPAGNPPHPAATAAPVAEDRAAAGLFVVLILVIAGAWIWWWFGPRRGAALTRATPVADDTSPT
jgi:hypothetical protein